MSALWECFWRGPVSSIGVLPRGAAVFPPNLFLFFCSYFSDVFAVGMGDISCFDSCRLKVQR